MRTGPLIGICLGLLLAAQPVLAETSSWSTQTQPGKPAAKPKPKPMAKPQPKGPKPLQASPAADPVSKFATEAPQGKSAPYLAPATGEDAAYIAFEQGQYLTALSLAEQAAKRDDPQAHTLIGRIYADGLGVPKDESVAARVPARGAELGDVEAAFALGLQLAEGRGVEKDMAAAARMFETAAA